MASPSLNVGLHHHISPLSWCDRLLERPLAGGCGCWGTTCERTGSNRQGMAAKQATSASSPQCSANPVATSASGAAVLVRCDQRRQTADICAQTLISLWPNQQLFARATNAPYDGVSSQHGRGGSKAKEIDLVLPGGRGGDWIEERGFRPYTISA